MLYTKNTVISSYFKIACIVGKLKKNEFKFFERTHIGNFLYKKKNGISINYISRIRSLSSSKYKEIVEKSSYNNCTFCKKKHNKNPVNLNTTAVATTIVTNNNNKFSNYSNYSNYSNDSNYDFRNSINNEKEKLAHSSVNNQENSNINKPKSIFVINKERTLEYRKRNYSIINLATESKFINNTFEFLKKRHYSTQKNMKIERLQEKRKKYLFEEFSVFSFNVLANSLVDNKYDKNCSEVINWINRKECIFDNIINKLSDIICLQEIENPYFNDLKSRLEKKHYKGLFLKKNKETCEDGVCIFYNTKVFKLLFFDEVIYDKSAVLSKWQIGLIIALKNLKTKKIEYYDESNNKSEIKEDYQNSNKSINNINDIIIVSNTHLIFDEYKGEIKLYQLCYITYRLVLIMNKCINYLKNNEDKKNKNSNILTPCIVFCGDFNLTPNSLLYYFIINRFINLKNISLHFISGQYLMFKKQYYFNNYSKGITIKKMFDENILNDLKCEKFNNSLDKIKKESLFFFFKNKNILNEEWITSIFSKNTNYLKDYNFLKFCNPIKNGDKAELFHKKAKTIYFKNESKKYECSNCVKSVPISEENRYFNYETDEEKHNFIENKIINHENKKEKNDDEDNEIQVKANELDNDLILYYPFYFKSVYNKHNDNRVERLCYKYENISELNNKENNLILNDIPFTVFHQKQKGCVDYIFYTYKNLKIISNTNLPSFDKLDKHGCLPNKKYSSSDHLYLHATLIRKDTE